MSPRCLLICAGIWMSLDGWAWNQRKLRAALWILRILGPDGCVLSTARSSWAVLPVAGQVDIDEFEDSLRGLREGGFISMVGDRLVPTPKLYEISMSAGQDREEMLYSQILNSTCPLWLRTATRNGDAECVFTELIPDDVARGIESIIPDPGRREAFLLSRARRVDADAKLRLGEEAEVAACKEFAAQLASLGESSLASMVCRVSLISDELGYDITAPRLDGSSRRVEVKGVRRTGKVASVIVTANEMAVGRSDPDWYLLIVEVADEANVVGWTVAKTLAPLLPVNQHHHGRWEAARLSVPLEYLVAGLPPPVSTVG